MHPYVAASMQAGALQKPEELEALVSFLDSTLGTNVTPLNAVIEIGCDAGGTLQLWHLLASDTLGIDLPDGRWGTPRKLERHGAEVILGDSHAPVVIDMAWLWQKERAPGGVDLLFVDGDHTYEGVKRDHEAYGVLVRKGGLIVFQDIVKHDEQAHPDVDVHRYWEEIKITSERYVEFVANDGEPWGGIGVIWKG